jgi:hypothetical protein
MMKARKKLPLAMRMPALAAVALSVLFVTPGTAAAAVPDGFTVYMDSRYCFSDGSVAFVDYGPGVPGNGYSNDDYVEITDDCNNSYGVTAYAWINGVYLGSKHNGNGWGSKVIWDPFPNGDVKGGDYVGLKICNQNTGGTAYDCVEFTRRSADG